MKQSSDLPFGSEFSPSQIDLPALLALAAAHNGNTGGIQTAIQDRFFSSHGGGNERNQKTLAMNCRLGMKAYGLIDDDSRLTDFGMTLHEMRDDERRLYESFSKHILLNLRGMGLIQCIRDMTAAGESVDLTTLRQGLAERGIHYPSGGKHPSMMRLWLSKAGVFVGSRWRINESRITEILGTEPDEFAHLAQLTTEQRTFLLALVNTGIAEPQPANAIVKLASTIYGVNFPEKSLPRKVLDPLVSAGYITAQKTTEGRGAKPFLVAPTAKLEEKVARPLLAQLEKQIDPKLLALLRKPLAAIQAELGSSDRFLAGLALEALAFKLMRLIDMKYVATRLRAQATGGAEIDLIFESDRLVFSRWQVQCKNTSRVSLDDVAKEVGLTNFLRSNVVVIVSTGEIGAEARRFANQVMATSNICLVMIDGRDLGSIQQSPSRILDVFSREAKHAMNLKKLGI